MANSAAKEILKSDGLPMCPAVLAGLMQALKDPDTTISDLARLLSSDPSLTVKVLRVVNSAFYSLPRRIYSVEQACFRLGFREIWSLTVAAQMSSVYAEIDTHWSDETLWDHVLKVALMARALAQRKRGVMPEELFTGGILHDIGKLALARHDPAGCSEVYGKGLYGRVAVEEERRRWNVGHDELGAVLLRHWKIPETLSGLVERHHDADWGGQMDHGTGLLTAADSLVHAIVVDAPGDDGDLVRLEITDPVLSTNLSRAMGLETADCVQIATEVIHDYGELVQHFK
jgi:putative nucleotidyltransferase with HDIG domain